MQHIVGQLAICYTGP